MKTASLYQKLKKKSVKCQVCQRRCVISEGQLGFCQTRINKDGELFTLLYGATTGLQIDPIEKKPFYHFNPGTLVASLGSFGCNFRCKQCLNWFDSWKTSNLAGLKNQTQTSLIKPEELIESVVRNGYPGIAFTYNEPTIWVEYVVDIAKLAKGVTSDQWSVTRSKSPTTSHQPPVTNHQSPAALYTVFVTNGSWTKETIDKLVGLIDAANIDFKGFSEKTYRKQGAFFGQIPEMAIYAQKKGIFLEITTLLIPGINDKKKELELLTKWVVKNLGHDTPWHLSQYDPSLAPDPKFRKIPPTSIEQLEKAAAIGQKAGLNHVYIWAPAAGYSQSDTICPQCKKIVIKRTGWIPKAINITPKGVCQFCGYKLNIKLNFC